jgi:hypothetical protein
MRATVFLVALAGLFAAEGTTLAQDKSARPAVTLLCTFTGETDKFPVVIDLNGKALRVGETPYRIYRIEQRLIWAREVKAKEGERPFHVQIDRLTGEFFGARADKDGDLGNGYTAQCSPGKGRMF